MFTIAVGLLNDLGLLFLGVFLMMIGALSPLREWMESIYLDKPKEVKIFNPDPLGYKIATDIERFAEMDRDWLKDHPTPLASVEVEDFAQIAAFWYRRADRFQEFTESEVCLSSSTNDFYRGLIEGLRYSAGHLAWFVTSPKREKST